METDPNFNNEENPPPKKPSGLELVLIIILLFFIALGTYEFGIWLIKDGSKIPQKIEQFP
jgi:hypothetical protein